MRWFRRRQAKHARNRVAFMGGGRHAAPARANALPDVRTHAVAVPALPLVTEETQPAPPAVPLAREAAPRAETPVVELRFADGSVVALTADDPRAREFRDAADALVRRRR